MKIVVLGSGGWGTALAMLLQDNGHSVVLWSHDAEKAEKMALERENPLLKNVRISDAITITSDLGCLHGAEMAVFASPSFALRSVARQTKDYLDPGAVLVSVTKGIEQGTHLRMSQIVAEETGGKYPVGVLSGPSHAEEVARRIPTGCVAAAADKETAELMQRVFGGKYFRVYAQSDMIGVEIAGALKNVAALCCGISDGYGLGDNTKAMLITRAIAEMSKLADRLGGHGETLSGLAGVGDLIVTCTSMHSRNRRAGLMIGQGIAPSAVVNEMGAVVEGYYAARSAKELADQLGVDMPICGTVYRVLYEGMKVDTAINMLMGRAQKAETAESWG